MLLDNLAQGVGSAQPRTAGVRGLLGLLYGGGQVAGYERVTYMTRGTLADRVVVDD